MISVIHTMCVHDLRWQPVYGRYLNPCVVLLVLYGLRGMQWPAGMERRFGYMVAASAAVALFFALYPLHWVRWNNYVALGYLLETAAIVRWAPALWSAGLIVLAGLWLCGRIHPAVRWISSMAVVALINVLGWYAQYHQSAPWDTFIRGYRSAMLTSRRVLVRVDTQQMPVPVVKGLARFWTLARRDGGPAIVAEPMRVSP